MKMTAKKILIIEDNALNMKLMRILLSQAGYDVREAIDAEQGIKMAKEQIPHLILMDIQLPGMDGLEATRIIRQDKSLLKVPIIAVTSYAMSGDEAKAIAAGCQGYVSKPIDTRGFVEYIKKFMN